MDSSFLSVFHPYYYPSFSVRLNTILISVDWRGLAFRPFLFLWLRLARARVHPWLNSLWGCGPTALDSPCNRWLAFSSLRLCVSAVQSLSGMEPTDE
jgi:hypothetical protein